MLNYKDLLFFDFDKLFSMSTCMKKKISNFTIIPFICLTTIIFFSTMYICMCVESFNLLLFR